MNKRELFKMYLTEDLSRAEENYKRWQESYEYYLQLPPKTVSRELIVYYRREAEVALALWQYKSKCYQRQLKSKSLED